MMYDTIRHMKRTTIFLPESLERQLQQVARRQEKPVAVVVREALTKHLDSQRQPFQMPRTFDSGRSDISERIDELLFEGLNPHGEPVSRAKRRRA
jgi:hypothetical protein